MHIHGVVSIDIDEEYYYIETGYTLNCAKIKVSRYYHLMVGEPTEHGEEFTVLIERP